MCTAASCDREKDVQRFAVFTNRTDQHCRSFQELYDVDKFTRSLEGAVNVVSELPAHVAARLPTVIRVPNGLSEDFIEEQIRPAFLANNYLKLASSFPSAGLGMREDRNDELESVACLAMFGSLEFKPAVSKVADTMIQRLQMLSRQFIAIDIRTEALGQQSCKEGKAGMKACYDVQEVVDFLRKLGFGKDSTVYVTQTWWDEALGPLKEYFPRTYTKVTTKVRPSSTIDLNLDRPVCSGVAGRLSAGGEEKGGAGDWE